MEYINRFLGNIVFWFYFQMYKKIEYFIIYSKEKPFKSSYFNKNRFERSIPINVDIYSPDRAAMADPIRLAFSI